MFDWDSDRAYQWSRVENVVVCTSMPGKPISDKEWNSFVNELKEFDVTTIFAMTTRDAVTANSTQRKIASDVMKAKSILTVVLTDDRVVRGVITALSWVGTKAKSYSWSDVDSALSNIDDPVVKKKVAGHIEDFRKRWRDPS